MAHTQVAQVSAPPQKTVLPGAALPLAHPLTPRMNSFGWATNGGPGPWVTGSGRQRSGCGMAASTRSCDVQSLIRVAGRLHPCSPGWQSHRQPLKRCSIRRSPRIHGTRACEFRLHGALQGVALHNGPDRRRAASDAREGREGMAAPDRGEPSAQTEPPTQCLPLRPPTRAQTAANSVPDAGACGDSARGARSNGIFPGRCGPSSCGRTCATAPTCRSLEPAPGGRSAIMPEPSEGWR